MQGEWRKKRTSRWWVRRFRWLLLAAVGGAAFYGVIRLVQALGAGEITSQVSSPARR